MREKGKHLGIYHVGTTEEVSIADLARRVAAQAGREIDLVAGKPAPGGTARRCPDISKLGRLGYKPRVTLGDGLKPTLDWYWRNVQLAPAERRRRSQALRPTKVARAAGTGASVPIEAVRCAAMRRSITCFRLATCRRSTRWCRSDRSRASSPGFRPRCCIAAIATWSSLASRSIRSFIFPPEYPYTSGTTKLLRDNFADLQRESAAMLGLGDQDLVVDIGSNDGTLLSNFQKGGQRVLGIEPTDVGDIANQRGIPTIKRYFGVEVARESQTRVWPASMVTAANCFRPHRGCARHRRRDRRDA